MQERSIGSNAAPGFRFAQAGLQTHQTPGLTAIFTSVNVARWMRQSPQN
jgi:hypothetical protein